VPDRAEKTRQVPEAGSATSPTSRHGPAACQKLHSKVLLNPLVCLLISSAIAAVGAIAQRRFLSEEAREHGMLVFISAMVLVVLVVNGYFWLTRRLLPKSPDQCPAVTERNTELQHEMVLFPFLSTACENAQAHLDEVNTLLPGIWGVMRPAQKGSKEQKKARRQELDVFRKSQEGIQHALDHIRQYTGQMAHPDARRIRDHEEDLRDLLQHLNEMIEKNHGRRPLNGRKVNKPELLTIVIRKGQDLAGSVETLEQALDGAVTAFSQPVDRAGDV